MLFIKARPTQVHMHYGGVTDRQTKMQAIGDMCDGYSRLEPAGTTAGATVVNLVTLDSAFSMANGTFPRIRVMKIDIEGGEINALLGARTLLEAGAVSNILLEVSPRWWKRAGTSMEQGVRLHV